jgi:hypothetical protein
MAIQNCPSYYCADDWASLPTDLCPGKFNGGISTAYLLKCGVTLEDVTEDGNPEVLDATKINALMVDLNIIKIPNIRVTINEPSALSSDSFDPCGGDETVNYDRTLVWEDPNVTRERLVFYNSINSAAGAIPPAGVLLVECDADRITAVFAELKFSGGRTSPAQNNERQVIRYNVTYRAPGDDMPFDIPSGLN